MPKKKQVLYPVFFMVLLTAVFTLALAVLNDVTADRIARLARVANQRSILYVFEIDAPESDAEVPEVYNSHITEDEVGGVPLFTYRENGEVQGHAFEIKGPGLWGTITSYVAVDEEFEELLGVDFISHSETPGLGGRIDEQWFKDQFRGIEIQPSDESVVFRPEVGGNVDAISGATSTSKAVRTILNDRISMLYQLTEGGESL